MMLKSPKNKRWAPVQLLSTVALLVAGLSTGCLNRKVGETVPKTTNVLVSQLTITKVDKIDMLFVIDNSISMADKQAILKDALPDLVDRFVSPVCVTTDPTTGATNQVSHPESAQESCPSGSGREFEPVNDIHIGVITTSLGGYGAPFDCVENVMIQDSEQTVDMAHLIGTLDRGAGIAGTDGFLRWTSGSDRSSFVTSFADMVEKAGEFGCGWEATLESWYRFLVDPYPYTEIVRQNCNYGNDTQKSCIGPNTDEGGVLLVDQAILDQRAQFMRPDSLLAIIMLSDENDCSFRATGQSWRLAQATNDANTSIRTAFKGTAACADTPNAECCHSCGAPAPAGCPTEVNADGDAVGVGCGMGRKYALADTDTGTPSLDSINLRCFQQKRRFGVDYLYPVERYVNALTATTLCPFADDLAANSPNCSADLVQVNPLFSSDRPEVTPRPKQLVFLAGIVGVPWQDLAANNDLVGELRYRQNRKTEDDANLRINWPLILGDPDAEIPNPGDPLMVESVDARQGTHPITSEPVAGPTSPDGTNSINGHEWSITQRNDLQYACIFPKPEETCISVDEDAMLRRMKQSVASCDCTQLGDPEDNSPLCEGLVQHSAKAYPSLRQLEVLRGFGQNSIVASICPKESGEDKKGLPDYGYRPAVAAIVDRLKEQLADRCLPRELGILNGSVSCHIVEAKRIGGDEANTCAALNKLSRAEPPANIRDVILERLESTKVCSNGATEGEALPSCGEFRLCQINQILAPENASCLNDASSPSGNGWCYIDPAKGEGFGSEELVAKCSDTQKRKLRFAGDGDPQSGSVVFFACAGEQL